MAAYGATTSLTPVATKVRSPSGYRTLSRNGRNYSKCPNPTIAQSEYGRRGLVEPVINDASARASSDSVIVRLAAACAKLTSCGPFDYLLLLAN